jgi:hypothetical protein
MPMLEQPLAGASEKLSAALGAGDPDQGDLWFAKKFKPLCRGSWEVGACFLRAIGVLPSRVKLIENKTGGSEYIPTDLRHLELFRQFLLEPGFYSYQDTSALTRAYLPARVVYPRTHFDQSPVTRSPVQFGGPVQPTFVVIVSAEPRKNLSALIRAFRKIPQADLVVIGYAGAR